MNDKISFFLVIKHGILNSKNLLWTFTFNCIFSPLIKKFALKIIFRVTFFNFIRCTCRICFGLTFEQGRKHMLGTFSTKTFLNNNKYFACCEFFRRSQPIFSQWVFAEKAHLNHATVAHHILQNANAGNY